MLRAGRRSASVIRTPSLDDGAPDPLVMSAEEFMGLPIVVIEHWPDDQVAIVSPKLAQTVPMGTAVYVGLALTSHDVLDRCGPARMAAKRSTR